MITMEGASLTINVLLTILSIGIMSFLSYGCYLLMRDEYEIKKMRKAKEKKNEKYN